MPILIDQLNVNARVRSETAQARKKQTTKDLSHAPVPPPVVLELLERALDAKRWP
ncbi:hypothetical protein [Endozoicomonas lisbonensis]|uniref:Uncharacterized protein n=1 Tax=Endozoicomonas lisbonensis TaxID=3120522 RepID=A0ABV2SAX6_9GAMM